MDPGTGYELAQAMSTTLASARSPLASAPTSTRVSLATPAPALPGLTPWTRRPALVAILAMVVGLGGTTVALRAFGSRAAAASPASSMPAAVSADSRAGEALASSAAGIEEASPAEAEASATPHEGPVASLAVSTELEDDTPVPTPAVQSSVPSLPPATPAASPASAPAKTHGPTLARLQSAPSGPARMAPSGKGRAPVAAPAARGAKAAPATKPAAKAKAVAPAVKAKAAPPAPKAKAAPGRGVHRVAVAHAPAKGGKPAAPKSHKG